MSESELQSIGNRSRLAACKLAETDSESRNHGLREMSKLLKCRTAEILAANQLDLENAQGQNVGTAILDRLTLNYARIDSMCEGLHQIEQLPDPLAVEPLEWSGPSGIKIQKVRVPFGVIGIIYENRPNVTVDCAGIGMKSGNAIILRGSSSTLRTNELLVRIIREALGSSGLPPAAVELVHSESRSVVLEMLQARDIFDLIIPRGGAELIRFVCDNARVPVIETGAGVCHLYVDKSAELEMAMNIAVNGKTQRPSVCNALETILVHQGWPQESLIKLVTLLRSKGVEVRGCSNLRRLIPDIVLASETDWSTEYLSLTISIKIVDSVEEAVTHIRTFGTRHSEAIVTSDNQVAEQFLKSVDAAAVYHNASTRFTDGYEFGFGAEIGISTQKLHARGPMGLPELTTYKYILRGDGLVRI